MSCCESADQNEILQILIISHNINPRLFHQFYGIDYNTNSVHNIVYNVPESENARELQRIQSQVSFDC